MTGIASAATSVLLGHIANGTTTLRVGSGGVILPNHSPLVIAEQFGPLATLYPGRVDLGLGRAPGTDQSTMLALRRHLANDVDNFPRDVQELLGYFDDVKPGQPVQVVPGQGLHVPIWLLGSSLYSAQLAAAMGLAFAFASHFAPDMLWQALSLYREHFTPSPTLAQPYAMVCINVIAADSERDARFLLPASCSPRCSSNLSICAAAGRARCRRRWKISRRCGRRVSNTVLIKLCGCRLLVMPRRSRAD